MNSTERRMLDMLKRGRDRFGIVAVKAEFEAEGTRPDELLRLTELVYRADLKLALKIGGCEAVSDLVASRLYGADYIIGPMVETPYALRKFIEAKEKTFGANEENTEFLFNLETETTLANLEAMLPLARGNVDGIVFGRVDFTLSRGLPRQAINERQITDAVLTVAQACAASHLELVVGGSVALEAASVLREVRQVRLDRFETRKVVFDGAAAETIGFEAGIANAVAFELAWLENKREYYNTIANEDLSRIHMMQERQRAARPQVLSLSA
ncbi:hypothetical protein NT2_09_00590 [Caenibius tardaugens NBRC 16725]|uniref:HpcH/HpaI aldolase/citrate lyase domain-containing protein n=1 Tax=Caenibius tardaugens NBRC 16725 TaxID=1219035 RepID=U2YAL0_9SPHN|nr:aldolase/citrate lyase family protein [Caenibius tardaugens]GAD50451.1 hypothetical protein NT2_09_00590 [Caenibius tardaugens NBRC 16725]